MEQTNELTFEHYKRLTKQMLFSNPQKYYPSFDTEIPLRRTIFSSSLLTLPRDELFNNIEVETRYRNISEGWMRPSELDVDATNYENDQDESDRMLYFNIEMSSKLSLFFERIREIIFVDSAYSQETRDTFEMYCGKFTKSLMTFFTHLSTRKKYIKCDFSQICDWMMIYYSCFFDEALFPLFLVETNFCFSPRFEEFLFRSTDATDARKNLFHKICNEEKLFQTFVDFLGKKRIWELLSTQNEEQKNFGINILASKYKNLLKIFPGNDTDNEIINIIRNFRGKNNMNVMHYMYIYTFTNSDIELTADELIFIRAKMSSFLELKYLNDATGDRPDSYLIGNYDNINLLLESEIISLSDLCIGFKKGDIEYQSHVMNQRLLTILEADYLTNLVSSHTEHMVNILVHSNLNNNTEDDEDEDEDDNLSNDDILDKIKNYIMSSDNSDICRERLTQKIKIFGYDDEYPLVAYMGILNQLEEMLTENKFNDVISDLLITYPFILPFRFLESGHRIKNFRNVYDVLIENNEVTYLLKYLDVLLESRKILDNLKSSSMKVITIHDLVTKLIDYAFKHDEIYKNNNFVLSTIAHIYDAVFFTEENKVTSNNVSNLLDDVLNKYPESFEIVLSRIVNIFIGHSPDVENDDDDNDNDIVQEMSCSLDKIIIPFYNKNKFMGADILSNKKLFVFKCTCCTESTNLLIDLMENESVKFSRESIFGDTPAELETTLSHYGSHNNGILVYHKLIDTGHLNNVYLTHYDKINDILKQKNVATTSAIVLLPGFDSLTLFNTETFLSAVTSHDISYVKWCLGYYDPPTEFKKNFIHKIILDDLTSESSQILCLTSEMIQILYKYRFFSPETIGNDYNKLTKIIIGLGEGVTFGKILSDIEPDNVSQLLNISVTNDDIDLVMLSILKYDCKIYERLFDSCDIFLEHTKKISSLLLITLTADDGDDTSLRENKLCSLLDKKIFCEEDICEKILKNKIYTSNATIIKSLLDNYDIIQLVKILNDGSFLIDYLKLTPADTFNLKHFLLMLLGYINKNEQVDELLEMLIKLILEIDYKWDLNTTLIFFKLIINVNIQNYKLIDETISNLNNLISGDIGSDMEVQIKSVFEEYISLCVKNDLEIIKSDIIFDMCPQFVLLQNDYDKSIDYIKSMPMEKLIKVVNSNLITVEIQDFILKGIQSSESNSDTLVNFLKCINIESPFITDNIHMILAIMMSDRSVYENFIKKKICLDKCLYEKDKNGDYLIFFSLSAVDADTFSKFMENVNMKELMSPNLRGKLRISHLCKESVISHMDNDLMDKLIIEILMKYDLLEKSTMGKKIYKFVVRCLSTRLDECDAIVKIIPEKIKYLTDENNKNIFMMLFDIGQFFHKSIVKSLKALPSDEKINVLKHSDNEGNNLLFYFVKNSSLINEMVDLYVATFGQNVLFESNNDNETLLMRSLKFNTDSVTSLLNNKHIGREQNYVYENTGCIMSYAALYCDSVAPFEQLLSWKHLDSNYLRLSQDIDQPYDWTSDDDPLRSLINVNANTLIIISIKRPDILKKLLNQNIDITEDLNNSFLKIGENNYSITELAYLYEPDSFHCLLGSKYFNKIKYNFSFFLKNADVQPASWYHYLQSNEFRSSNHANSEFYGLHSNLRPNYIDSVSHYIQTKHEPLTSKSDRCDICLTGKKKIMFGCHKHLTCVRCSFKMEVCSNCRHDGDKIKVFD